MRVLAPLVAGSLAASVAEGLQVGWAAHHGELGSAIAIGAGLEASAILLCALAALTTVVSLLARIIRVPALPERLQRATRPLLFGAVVAAAILIGRRYEVPQEVTITCSAGAMGLTFGTIDGIEPRIARVGWFVTSTALALTLPAFPLLSRLSPTTCHLVVHQAPFAGAIVTGVRTLFDRDRDGFSSILAGGDCNDADARVHPGAADIPGNGIDENCSGADAKPFAASVEPVSERPSTLPDRPSIVLVQLDALRPDHLGFAGYARKTSPNLDAFRASATWFRRAYTPAPSTRFAMTALFTGRHVPDIPLRYGAKLNVTLEPSVPTLAGELGNAGYDRIGYTISYVVHHIAGLERGYRAWQTPWRLDDWEAATARSATLTTEAARRTLVQLPDDAAHPWMLFLHYRCTHDPYAAQERWSFGSSAIDRYDSAIAYCDDEVGNLLRALDSRGDRDRVVVAIFSDHGELFGEHGFSYHGNTLYEPDVRALLLLRVPGIEHVATVEAPVSLLDLHATVLDVAGISPRPPSVGWSLVPYLSGQNAAAKRPLFLYSDLTRNGVRHQGRAVLLHPLKLVRDLSTGGAELYDVEADPNERVDLSSRLPKESAELEDLLDAWSAPR